MFDDTLLMSGHQQSRHFTLAATDALEIIMTQA